MNWQPFSLHFKQVYDGGYRYLDRCGHVMMLIEEQLGLMPEDANPNGCKMILPERGITLGMGPSELVLSQEFQKDGGVEFIGLCQALADLVSEHFLPRHVEMNGFASKSFRDMRSIEASQAASLKMGKGFAADLVQDVDMVARQEKLDCHFAAGSMTLHLKVEPVTFQSLTMNKFNATPFATGANKRRLERLNQRSNRFDNTLSQVLMMEVDLIELDPPAIPLKKHFDMMQRKEQNLHTRFSIS